MKLFLQLAILISSFYSNSAFAQSKLYEIEMKLNVFNIISDVGLQSPNNTVQPTKSFTCKLSVTVSNEPKYFNYDHTTYGISTTRTLAQFVAKEQVSFALDCPYDEKNPLRLLFLQEYGFTKGSSHVETTTTSSGQTYHFVNDELGCVVGLNGYNGRVSKCPAVAYQLPSRLSFSKLPVNKGEFPIYLILEGGEATVGGSPDLIVGTYKLL